MTKSLVAFDTDKIKNYVFATDTLKEIRGASHILDDLNTKMVNLVGGECIYARGGSGLFILPTEDVASAIARVKQAYARQTGGAATISGVSLELPAGFDEQNDYVQTFYRHLGWKLVAEKARNPETMTSVTHPLLHFGHTDGTFYATKDVEGDLISDVSRLKRIRNKEIGLSERQERPENFESIANASTPAGTFALIVADGDGFGEHFKDCTTLGELKQLSEDIETIITDILNNVGQIANLRKDQYDVLLQAGDDLVLAVPSHKALDIALSITREFQQQTQQRLEKALSLSTAIVWAHYKFPFHVWHDIAESTLKFAKQERAKRKMCDPLINFLVISSANHLEFSGFYNNTLINQEEHCEWKVYRTMRPYTIECLRKLIKYRKKLSSMPRSKLESLRRSIFLATPHQAMIDSLHTLVHWRGEKTKKCIWQMVHDFAPPSHQIAFPFALNEKEQDPCDPDEQIKVYQTPLADLAEVWDFIPGASDET